MKIRNIIIINIAILIAFILFTSTILLNPKEKTLERKPEFRWTGLATTYTIMIDDNLDFSTPIIQKVDGKTFTPEENLELGEQYWKVKGIRESQVNKFTIESKVSIKKEQEDLKNDGNTRLKLETIPVTGAAILDIDDTIKLAEEVQEAIAKQDE